MTQRLFIQFNLLAIGIVVCLLYVGCVRQQSVSPTAPPEKALTPIASPLPKKKNPPSQAETLTVILSNNGEACRTVADQIRTRSGPTAREIILDRQGLTQDLAGNDTGPIVALGLEAAQAVAPLAKKRVVIFSLVFNFREHRLLEQGLIGVSMLPPPSQVLDLLRELQAGDIRLAMPTGGGMQDYTTLVRTAAKHSHIEPITSEVGSDKELLHYASRLDPTVNAFWLLPDNRILSRDALQKLIAANVKNGRQSIVFSPELFAYGGLISARFSAPAIADAVLSISKKAPNEKNLLRGTLLQPNGSTLQINADLAQTLGLKIPPSRQNLIWSGK